MRQFLFILLTLGSLNSSKASAKSLDIPSDLSPKQMKIWLKRTTYDGKMKVMSYSKARNLMYNYIDNLDNKIIGVYSGYSIDWSYGGDNHNPYPINCEHTVPQSFFKSRSPMKSDLHHIYPAYFRWNIYRSNLPYGEIEDTNTIKRFKFSPKPIKTTEI